MTTPAASVATITPRPVRLGIIGAGFISQVTHLHAARWSPLVSLVGLSDARIRLCREVGDDFHISRTFAHHRELLSDAEIEAVIVCVHRRCLAPIVAEAIAAGKAVLSEKPMASSTAQANRLLEASIALTHQRPFAIGFMRRYDPGVIQFRELLRELIASERFGSIVHVMLRDFCPTYSIAVPPHRPTTEVEAYRYDQWSRAPDDFPADWLNDYEYTLNVGSHDINLLRFLLRTPLAARSFDVRGGRLQTALFEASTFDVSMAIGRSDAGRWDQSVEVLFEQGRLRLDLPSPLARQETGKSSISGAGVSERIEIPAAAAQWAFAAQLDSFARACRGETTLTTTASECVADFTLIENLWAICRWRT